MNTAQQQVLKYLEEAEEVYLDWTGEEATVDGDTRDREPIIAIAQILVDLHGRENENNND